MNIFIGTPAYGGMIHIDYLNSILDFHKEKMPITVMNIGNESLITRGRNTVISYFHAMKQFSHLLFLDADVGISAAGLKTLLSHNKDVIGAVCRLKGENAINAYGMKGNGNLKVVDCVGTAVFMLSRRAVDMLVSKAPTYSRNPLSRGRNDDIPMYDCFQCGVVNGEYLSEDYFVCNTLKKNGFEIYVDTSVSTRHNGNYVFIYEGGL